MRLICPDCSAQYEIDASLIPDAGRDVQCSNCGHTWFQEKEDEGDGPVEAAPVPADGPPTTEGVAWPRPQAAVEPDVEDDDALEFDDDLDDDEDDDLPLEDLPRREIDPATRDILKEEADRELARRAVEPAAIETQSDMDLPADDAAQSHAWRARVSRLQDDPTDPAPQTEFDVEDEVDEEPSQPVEPQEAAAPVEAPVSKEPVRSDRRRSDLLPDIEDINSSLASRPRRSDLYEAKQQREFRSGFAASIAVAALLLLLYVFAPQIAGAIPAAEGFLVSYVDAANGARDSLDAFFGG